MENIKLYRKRFMPDECVLLKDDIVIYRDDDIIVTKWHTIRPRNDFDRGASVYYINEGYKVSEMYLGTEKIYIYCDVIDIKKSDDVYTCIDLLADVIVENNGLVRVMDIGEIGECLDWGVINSDIAKDALIKLDSLLMKIYAGKIEELLAPIHTHKAYDIE